MPAKTIRVIALFKSKPGKVEALQEFLSNFIEPTLKEKGCIAYELHQNAGDPADFAFIEEWEDNATLDAHLQSAHIQKAIPLIGDFIIGSPDIRRYVKCD